MRLCIEVFLHDRRTDEPWPIMSAHTPVRIPVMITTMAFATVKPEYLHARSNKHLFNDLNNMFMGCFDPVNICFIVFVYNMNKQF